MQYAIVDLVVIVLSGTRPTRYLWADFEKKPGAMVSVEEAKWRVEDLQRLAHWCQEDLYGGTSIKEELDTLREEAEARRKGLDHEWLDVNALDMYLRVARPYTG